MSFKDTIFALATPQGRSAIALFRISGKDSHNIIKKISSSKKTEINKPLLRIIHDQKQLAIDQTVITLFKSPKSFTGENMVEISCHGGMAVIKKISNTLLNSGTRMAEPGEFTRRALNNDKLDLTKVEGLADLINANTEKQREIAFNNLRGTLTNYLGEISKKLKNTLANVEALIDFSDEDLPGNTVKKIKEQTENIIVDLEKTVKRSDVSKAIRNGYFVAVIGKPNTGKSSFINHVSGRDVSIVTKIPGTTTDLVESLIDVSGYQIRLVDTAGIRRHRNRVEKIGINKTIEASLAADLNIIFLEKKEKSKYANIKNKIFVRSKQDIRDKNTNDREILDISSKTGHGIDRLIKKSIKFLTPKNQSEAPIISRERQLAKVKKCLKHLKSFNLEKNIDMAAADIRSALKEINEIYHKFDIEEILDIIFNDFCIGK